MVLGNYPLGAAALHPDWPNARFNVSGALEFHSLVLHFLDLVREGFSCRAPITAMHGAPSICWNGGRVLTDSCNETQFRKMLSALQSAGIGYFPTFTNHLIEKADLGDYVGNSILDAIAQRPDLNGVIVTSDLLSDYIARKYPTLPQIASIVKVTLEHGGGRVDYYRRLAQRFHRVVVHPDDIRNLALLEQLDREKTEIIVNENCAANCKNRVRHYANSALRQRLASVKRNTAVLNAVSPASEDLWALQEIKEIMATCDAPLNKAGLASHRRSCNLTHDEMKAVYDLGFRHFKLQGRGGFAFNYVYDLTRFILEPDFAAPAVCKTLCRLVHGYEP
jgi:hypothetical protein